MNKIGEGRYGEVTRDNEIAIKKQKLMYVKDDVYRLWAIPLKEISILQLLNHSQIIKPYKVYRKENDIFMEIPLLEEISGLRDVIQMMISSLEALIYLHDNGIIHGDIKTDNILIENNKCVLIDFGACKFDKYKEKVGTSLYRSPEVERSFPSDVWSLGIFFLIITGNGNIYEMMNIPEDINDGEAYKYVLKYMEGVDDLLFKGMLQEDPNKRWTTRECYKYLTDIEYPKITIEYPQILPTNNIKIMREKILGKFIIIFSKISMMYFNNFVGIHDKFFANIHNILWEDYVEYSVVIFGITMAIFSENKDHYMNEFLLELSKKISGRTLQNDRFRDIFYYVGDTLGWNFMIIGKD